MTNTIHRAYLLAWLMVAASLTLIVTLYMAATGKQNLPDMTGLMSLFIIGLTAVGGINLMTVPGQGIKFTGRGNYENGGHFNGAGFSDAGAGGGMGTARSGVDGRAAHDYQ